MVSRPWFAIKSAAVCKLGKSKIPGPAVISNSIANSAKVFWTHHIPQLRLNGARRSASAGLKEPHE
jgi:hypothetical protein